MRVVVTGLVATYPVGGVAWDYLQYVQGFHALGCEVSYVEDTGFAADLERGPGLHPFSAMEDAVAGLAAVRADYARACEHARALAEQSFAAERVLARLLRDAGL